MITAGQEAVSHKSLVIRREPKESAVGWNYWFQLLKIFVKKLLLKFATCHLPSHISGEWWAPEDKFARVPRTGIYSRVVSRNSTLDYIGLSTMEISWQLLCFSIPFSFPLTKTSVSNKSRGECSSHLAKRTGQLWLCQVVPDRPPHRMVPHGVAGGDKVLWEPGKYTSKPMATRICSDKKLIPHTDQL